MGEILIALRYLVVVGGVVEHCVAAMPAAGSVIQKVGKLPRARYS